MRSRDGLDFAATIAGLAVMAWGLWGSPADPEGTKGVGLGLLIGPIARWFVEVYRAARIMRAQ